MVKRKIHWIRKQKGSDYRGRFVWYFDWIPACGNRKVFSILDATTVRKKVTCKKCLSIMKKKGLLP